MQPVTGWRHTLYYCGGKSPSERQETLARIREVFENRCRWVETCNQERTLVEAAERERARLAALLRGSLADIRPVHQEVTDLLQGQVFENFDTSQATQALTELTHTIEAIERRYEAEDHLAQFLAKPSQFLTKNFWPTGVGDLSPLFKDYESSVAYAEAIEGVAKRVGDLTGSVRLREPRPPDRADIEDQYHEMKPCDRPHFDQQANNMFAMQLEVLAAEIRGAQERLDRCGNPAGGLRLLVDALAGSLEGLAPRLEATRRRLDPDAYEVPQHPIDEANLRATNALHHLKFKRAYTYSTIALVSLLFLKKARRYKTLMAAAAFCGAGMHISGQWARAKAEEAVCEYYRHHGMQEGPEPMSKERFYELMAPHTEENKPLRQALERLLPR